MKYITALTALCITSYAVHGMDKQEYVIPQAMIVHAKPIQTLCILTHCTLTHFNQNPKTTRKKLIEIIEKMNSLKLAQPPIKETEMGFYCYNQKTDSLAESVNATLFGSTPVSITRSVFFARLAQYNDDLQRKSLTSPNNQQVKNYFKNLERNNLVAKNARHNIIIPQQTINELTLSTPTSVGIEQFVTFLKDIEAFLQNYSLEEMYQTAALIYHDQLNKR